MRLARVGLEKVVGWLAGGLDEWREKGFAVDTLEQVTVGELHHRLSEPPSDSAPSFQVVDVRRDGEWAGGRIAGALEPGDRVIITEDAVTRGVSMLEAADVVRSEGAAEPVLLLPVVDRGGTVEAMAAEHGLPLRALVTAPDLGFPYEG